jgi:hypothetical protein
MSVTVCNTCDALLCLGVLSVGNRSLYLEDGAPVLMKGSVRYGLWL